LDLNQLMLNFLIYINIFFFTLKRLLFFFFVTYYLKIELDLIANLLAGAFIFLSKLMKISTFGLSFREYEL